MKTFAISCTAAVLLALAVPVFAADFLVPAGFGDANDAGKANLAKGFDLTSVRPVALAFDGTTISPTADTFEGPYCGPSEYGYIDLGENFAQVRITTACTSYFPYTPAAKTGKLFQKAYFSSDPLATAPASETDKTDLNFGGDDVASTGEQGVWVLSAKYEKPIVPTARYLVFQLAEKPTERFNQLAIIVAGDPPTAPKK